MHVCDERHVESERARARAREREERETARALVIAHPKSKAHAVILRGTGCVEQGG